MDTHIREVVRKLVDGLALDTDIVCVYVYGSRVRGDCEPGSGIRS
jgi:predicted nucleotidyltransferase